MTIDTNGEAVLAFARRAKNLGRIAELTDVITDIVKARAWRHYITATGEKQWRAAELDYFLISCELRQNDVARAIAWSQKGKELAPLMDPAASPRRRRPLEKASESYVTGTGSSLMDMARDLGWASSDNGSMPGPGRPRLSVATPVSTRARHTARRGQSNEAHARLRREERIPVARRRELDRLVGETLEQLVDGDERRYLIDQLRDAVKGERSHKSA